MKKILLILAALALVCGGLFMAFQALISGMGQHYETQEEIAARLQREADSARFWQTVVFVIVAVITLVILLVVWQVIAHYSHKRRMEQLRFAEDRYRLTPDSNGNYPARFDKYGQLVTVEPGNTPYAPVTQWINANIPIQKIPNERPAQRDMPLLINDRANYVRNYTSRRNAREIEFEGYSVRELQPEQITPPDPNRNIPASQVFEATNSGFEAEEPKQTDQTEQTNDLLVAQLRDAKAKGEGKQRALKRIVGVSANGSPKYKAWCEIFDQL